jgi:hypothetical protein
VTCVTDVNSKNVEAICLMVVRNKWSFP